MQTLRDCLQCDRPPPISGRSAAQRPAANRLAVTCQAQRSDNGAGPQAPKATQGCKETYPNESLELSAEDGLFPRRQPGDFPAVGVTKGLRKRLQNVVSSLRGADKSGGAAATAEAPTAAGTGEAAEYDPLRDGPLRYLGYSNECGEAFAAWLPAGGVPVSYAIAISYVLVDTYDKFARARKQAREELDSIDVDPAVNEDRLVGLLAAERALDTVVWQMLASVIIPGYTIHTVVGLVSAALVQAEATEQLQAAIASVAPGLHTTASTLAALVDKSLPTMIGLAVIPFIVHPIDETVHLILNKSLRPTGKKFLCGPGQGALAGLEICEDCKEECAIEE